MYEQDNQKALLNAMDRLEEYTRLMQSTINTIQSINTLCAVTEMDCGHVKEFKVQVMTRIHEDLRSLHDAMMKL